MNDNFELWFQIIQTTQNTLADVQEKLDRQYAQAAEELGMTKEEFIERCALMCQQELAEVEAL